MRHLIRIITVIMIAAFLAVAFTGCNMDSLSAMAEILPFELPVKEVFGGEVVSAGSSVGSPQSILEGESGGEGESYSDEELDGESSDLSEEIDGR